MHLRRVTSLTALLSSIFTLFTSVILYLVPAGRISYWADWRFWGLTKEDWTGIHVNLGALFLISIVFHTYYNWKPITTYLKNKAHQMKVLTPDFTVALILVAAFVVGTIAYVPPFSSFLDLSTNIKEDAATKFGEPPYGHAELSSLKTLTTRMGLDLEKSMQNLKDAGYPAESDSQTIKEIARKYGRSPQQIYLAMKPEAPKEAVHSGVAVAMPVDPPTGTGSLTLAELCHQYNLNIRTVTRGLKEQGLTAGETQTIKEIAAANNKGPIDVYMAIRTIVEASLAPSKPEPAAADAVSTGYGRMTLAEASEKLGIPVDQAVEKLKGLGLSPQPDDKVRDLAEKAGSTPLDLMESLK